MSVVTITGAGGFIGKVLVQSLLDMGHQIRAVVRTPPVHFLPTVKYFECRDIDCRNEWDKALEGADAVVHLISRVHMMNDVASNADEYRRVNIQASVAFAHACIEHSIKRLVYISTIKVNGEVTSTRPFTADDVPSSTHEIYAKTKREAESALLNIGHETDLEVTVIRPPLVYGPNVKGNFLAIMTAVSKQWPLPFASISNARSLVSVFNLCDLIGVCLIHPAAAGEVFLVCDGEDVSTPELIRLLAKAMHRKPRLIACPVKLLRFAGALLGKGDKIDRLCRDLQVDMSKTRRLLNWDPPLALAEGIERTVQEFI